IVHTLRTHMTNPMMSSVLVVIPSYFLFVLSIRLPPTSTLFPYTTLFRSNPAIQIENGTKIVGLADTAATKLQNLGLSVLPSQNRSEEHTSELQSLAYLVCRLLLEKKKRTTAGSASSSPRSVATRSPSLRP